MGPNSPAVLPHIRDLPQFSVIPLERRAGVFDVVDVVDAVAIVTHLPDGEGFCFVVAIAGPAEDHLLTDPET